MDAAEWIALASLVLNLAIFGLQSKTKADISSLKAEMFEKFITKDDAHIMLRLRQR